MTLSRRALLRSLVPAGSALALAACVEEDAVHFSIAEPGEGPEPLLDQTAAPPARAQEPPAIRLLSRTVAQGGTFLVGLTGDGIASAEVEFRDWVYPTAWEGGAFLAVVPAGQVVGSTAQPSPGTYPLGVRFELEGDPTPRTLQSTIAITPTNFPVEYLTFDPQTATLLDPALTEQEVAILGDAYGTFRPPRMWDGFFVRPSRASISDVYGSRRSYQGGPVTGSHSGVDFGAAAGQPVAAAAHGRVAMARRVPVRGNMIILDHGLGVFTGYCHLSEIWVAPGQAVRAGEQIGAVGATGLVTGAHLHWEVVAGGQHVDGLRWLG
jgi:murein DD-endopeptidase MepM/ murein hydrolase activator NlpD